MDGQQNIKWGIVVQVPAGKVILLFHEIYVILQDSSSQNYTQWGRLVKEEINLRYPYTAERPSPLIKNSDPRVGQIESASVSPLSFLFHIQ
jgi:hypothetical protein